MPAKAAATPSTAMPVDDQMAVQRQGAMSMGLMFSQPNAYAASGTGISSGMRNVSVESGCGRPNCCPAMENAAIISNTKYTVRSNAAVTPRLQPPGLLNAPFDAE